MKNVASDRTRRAERKRMIKLNDYLYSGDTVLKIIQTYANDLRKSALHTGNELDLAHS